MLGIFCQGKAFIGYCNTGGNFQVSFFLLHNPLDTNYPLHITHYPLSIIFPAILLRKSHKDL